MSNEIQIGLNFAVNNPATGGGYSNTQRFNLQLNQNAVGATGEIIAVPTTATTYSFPFVATYGWCLLQNLDAANYVTYGATVSSTYAPLGKLEAGEVHLLRLDPGITFTMQANTASVNVNLLLLED